jgi:hypothetical protein
MINILHSHDEFLKIEKIYFMKWKKMKEHDNVSQIKKLTIFFFGKVKIKAFFAAL